MGSDTVQWGQKPGCAEGRRAALGPGICARLEVGGLSRMAAPRSHLRRFPRKSQWEEAAGGRGSREELPVRTPHRHREAPLGLSASPSEQPRVAGRGHVQTGLTASELPDGSSQQLCEGPHLLTPAVT